MIYMPTGRMLVVIVTSLLWGGLLILEVLTNSPREFVKLTMISCRLEFLASFIHRYIAPAYSEGLATNSCTSVEPACR